MLFLSSDDPRMALRGSRAPAVGNSAMLVYQALLLAGYAYAHASAGCPRRQGWSISGCSARAISLRSP